jgi:hypothetical protein
MPTGAGNLKLTVSCCLAFRLRIGLAEGVKPEFDEASILAGAARDIAKENGFPFADVHDVMMDVMAKAKKKKSA